MQNSKICENIERLVQYGLKYNLIKDEDIFVARNTYMDIFSIAEPCTDEQILHISKEDYPLTPETLLAPVLDYAAENNFFDGQVDALRVNFEARLMGVLMPRQSEISDKFNMLYNTKGAIAATEYFYDLCIKSNYIRSAQIAQNKQWGYPCKYGELEITINLTKPEKDPKTIALERLQPAASYPKCMLCIENIGYAGRINFPARQTHRAMPIDICGGKFYLQYSPYVYYNEHCIIFSAHHTPMTVNAGTFKELLSFVKQFKHYTCGSNADLPIVGGSILSHAHYQGGNYIFPMHRAKTLSIYKSAEFKNIQVHKINWPMTTLRVKSDDENELCNFAAMALEKWREYEDKNADVLPYSDENGKKTPHNTITPILHFEESEQKYVLDLVLRNNRTSEEHPLGIFHPHAEIHHIKKENIGLIEVMGLAILPSRLQDESAEIAKVLTGEKDKDEAKAELAIHAEWIDYLCAKHGNALSTAAAQSIIKEEIGAKFETCLTHCAVFAESESGDKSYDNFMMALGFEK